MRERKRMRRGYKKERNIEDAEEQEEGRRRERGGAKAQRWDGLR